MGAPAAARRNQFTWHPYLTSKSSYGLFVIWRRGIRRGALLSAWEFAINPARYDDGLRRARASSREVGVARYRHFICQGCSSLPCIC